MVLGACGASGSTEPSLGSPTAATILPTESPSASPSESPTATPTPSPSPSPSPSPAAAAFTLDSQVWWSGYVITVTGGTYNPLKHTMTINADFQNTSTQATDLSQVSTGVKVVWNGQFLPGYLDVGAGPVGATTSGVIQLQPPAGCVGHERGADVRPARRAPDGRAAAREEALPGISRRPSRCPGRDRMGKYVTITSATR